MRLLDWLLIADQTDDSLPRLLIAMGKGLHVLALGHEAQILVMVCHRGSLAI